MSEAKKTRRKMDDKTLVSIIKAHRANALGTEDGDLSQQRASAMDHYHGRPYGNEVEGRSQVVSRDLAEAVDWVMPAIMKVFTQSGRIAEFDPVGPEDEQLAQQESDYTNQVMMKDNAGFMVLHDAIKDTLLLKNGYTKHFWEESDKIEETQYRALTMDAIVMMEQKIKAKGGEVEYVGVESYFEELPGTVGPIPVEKFNLKIKTKTKQGKVIWDAIPTEEMRVSKKCRGTLQESPFTEHVTLKTRSELRELGMSADFVESLASYSESKNSSQAFSRDSVDDESDNYTTSTGDKSMDEIEYCEAYLRVDYDGDGIAELRKVVTCADQIPPGEDWNEPIAAVPATGFVAKRIPHRHTGESLDDELKDLQEIMTVLKRQLLDNIYLNNNNELVLNEDANVRDFMTRTPGGLKRVKGSGPVQSAVMALTVPSIIGQILPVIDFFEQSKETRTGISKATTGLDPDVLQNTTKGAFMENLNKASQKTEMITRMLAETGVKECVLQVHALLIRHQDQPRTVQLRGKWVPVNPQEWKNRTDLTVRVGLGTGSEEEKRQKLQLLVGLQGPLMGALAGAPPAVYEKMYALFADVAETLGVDAPEKYAVAPNSPQHQQLIAQAQQAKQGGDPRAAAEMAKITQQGQLERERMQNQMQVDRNRQEMEAQQHAARLEQEAQLARFEAMLKAQSEQQTAAMDMQFNRWKAELEAAVKIQTANIASKSKVADAATATATGEIAAEVTQDGGMQHQMPDGTMMDGPPMDQQTMPPDGMTE